MSPGDDVKKFFDAAMPAITTDARLTAVGVLLGGRNRGVSDALISMASNLAAARFIEAEILRMLSLDPKDPFADGVRVAAEAALGELNLSIEAFRTSVRGGG